MSHEFMTLMIFIASEEYFRKLQVTLPIEQVVRKRETIRILIKSVNNFAITKSIYKDKNNNKFKNKFVKAFCNMRLQYYIDIHKFS